MNHMTLIVDVESHGVIENMLAFVGVSDLKRNFVILDNDGSENGRLIQEDRSNYKPYYAMNESGIWAVPQDNGFWGKSAPAPKTPTPKTNP